MNAPSHPQFQPPFPGPPQPLPPQQNGGQARQSQGQHPSGNGPQHTGNQGPQGPRFDVDPRLALWTFKKGKNPSWQDVQPRQQQVSSESLEQELHRMRASGVSIQSTLNEIPSENAYSNLTRLVREQNAELSRLNAKLEWKIAGIELGKKSINRHHTQLKSINVILKTEPRALAQGSSSRVNTHGTQLDSSNPPRTDKPPSMPQIHVQVQGQGQASAPKNTQQGPHQMPNQQFNHPQGRGQVQNQGNSQGPPPPPPLPLSQNAPQGMPGPSPPPLPPPPHHGAPLNPQEHNQTFHPQGLPPPGPYPDARPHPSMRHDPPKFPPIDPSQNSKARNLPGGFPSEGDSDSESGTDSDSSGSVSYTAVSIGEPDYGFVAGRSRSSSRKEFNERHQSRARSATRGMGSRSHSRKPSHGQHNASVGPPPIGTHSKTSKVDSPRSSHSSIKSPGIQNHYSRPPPTVHDRDYDEPNRDRDRTRGREYHHGRDSDRNRARDRDYENERDSDRDRARARSRTSRDGEGRRWNQDISPSRKARDSYKKPEKFDKFAAAHPMSRNSSSSTSRDSRTSFGEDSPSIISSSDSTFSDIEYSAGRRGGSHYHHRECFPRERDDNRRRLVRYPTDHMYDDCPRPQRHQAHHRHSHGFSNHTDFMQGLDGAYSDEHGSLITGGPRPTTRRHSTQVAPYSQDPPRFPRSYTYAEYVPEPSHDYCTPLKALPSTQPHQQDTREELIQDVVVDVVEALQQKQALEHIQNSQIRPLMRRRNTLRPWLV